MYESILKKYWGYDHFRGIQKNIIESIGKGRDTLGLMPTGGGKSITFQVPALTKEGTCIVVTPLIALMKDQVQNLRKKGIKATAIYSGLTRQEILTALDNCILGDYKFLYVSPERLSTQIFQTKLQHMQISFITVDEAHCISQWGYDFRPSYLKIAEIRKLLPNTPILALTATATIEVVKDIQEKLEFNNGQVFRMSFERENLSYIVRHTEDKEGELLHILNSTPGSTIIYVRNRKSTKDIAKWLVENGVTATFYHAGLSNLEKDQRQKAWHDDEIRVMVATNAFGMGIDKPDVRLVIHIQLPDSPEAYFQEAGRAGRDGLRAYAVLLYHKGDRTKLLKHISEAYPSKEFIQNVYEHLAYYYQMAMGDGFMVTKEFNLEEFCIRFKHHPVQTYSALKLLSQIGLIDYTEEQESNSRLMFTVKRDDLYKFQDLEDTKDKIIQGILRCYGGVFADYVYIEEDLLAHVTNLTRMEVYENLISLSRIGIIHYIPRKHTPYITYMQKRVDSTRIYFPKEIYENRKSQLELRIKSMIEYAESKNTCRSEMLLRYFGEEKIHPCGHCDVCLEKKKKPKSIKCFNEASKKILEILKDKKPHQLTELLQGQEKDVIEQAIRILIQEEFISQIGNLFYLK